MAEGGLRRLEPGWPVSGWPGTIGQVITVIGQVIKVIGQLMKVIGPRGAGGRGMCARSLQALTLLASITCSNGARIAVLPKCGELATAKSESRS